MKLYNPDNPLTDLVQNFTILNVTGNSTYIHLNFVYPQLVSYSSATKDRIQVNITNNRMFQDADSKFFVLKETPPKNSTVPKQNIHQILDQLENFSKNVVNTLWVVFIVSGLLKFAFKFSLKRIWSTMNII